MSGYEHAWLADLGELTGRGVPCVLVTVMEAKGSTPREAGAKMIVTADGASGTIGGGNLEFEAIAEARKLLQAASGPVVKDYPLGPALAQCCGGAVSVFLEPFVPVNKTLYLFGAGHVGREVVKVLDGLPVRVHWIDARAQEFPADIPKNCRKICTAAPVAELRNATPDDFIVVMTHDHDLDLELVQAAFRQGAFFYLGLIGSDTKRARFEKRLKAAGVAEGDLARLTCPIGIGGVTGKHPREIAIALAAELLSLGLSRAGKVGAENAA